MKENYKKILDLCKEPKELLKFHYILCGAFIDSGYCDGKSCDDCMVHQYFIECMAKFAD